VPHHAAAFHLFARKIPYALVGSSAGLPIDSTDPPFVPSDEDPPSPILAKARQESTEIQQQDRCYAQHQNDRFSFVDLFLEEGHAAEHRKQDDTDVEHRV